MKDWEASPGQFADSAVLMLVDGPQAQLLSRACFGQSFPPAVQPASSASTYPPSVPEEGMQLRQLGLEEAFFLNYELKCKCIGIHGQTPEGRIKLNHEDLWKLMERSKKRLAPKDRPCSCYMSHPRRTMLRLSFPSVLDTYHAEALEVERWIPEKHREDVGFEEEQMS